MTKIQRVTTMTLGIVALLILPASSQASRGRDSDHSDDSNDYEHAECVAWGAPGGGGVVEDSDLDGLTDDFELHNGLDPSSPDTDSDGIPDGDELIGSTSPDDPDTDGDHLPDLDDPDPTGQFDTDLRGALELVDPVQGTVIVAGSIVDVSSAIFEYGVGIGSLQPGMFVEIDIDPNSPVGGPLVAWKVSIEDSDGNGGDVDHPNDGDDPNDIDVPNHPGDIDGGSGNSNPGSGNVCRKYHREVRLTRGPNVSVGRAFAEYGEKRCNGEFEVKIRRLPPGSYDLMVDGIYRGSIQAIPNRKGRTEGEIDFRSIIENVTDLPLDFDPRGVLIEIEQGGQLLFSGTLRQ
ncbi:MAG: hypothetical protein ACE5F1_00835 [Planctomycetota bacterium]